VTALGTQASSKQNARAYVNQTVEPCVSQQALARKIVWLGSSEGEVAAMSLSFINPEEILLADTGF
jgi:hypothetical protein